MADVIHFNGVHLLHVNGGRGSCPSSSLSLSLFFLPLHFTANGGGKETRNDNKTEILKMNFVEQSSGCVSASLLR